MIKQLTSVYYSETNIKMNVHSNIQPIFLSIYNYAGY